MQSQQIDTIVQNLQNAKQLLGNSQSLEQLDQYLCLVEEIKEDIMKQKHLKLLQQKEVNEQKYVQLIQNDLKENIIFENIKGEPGMEFIEKQVEYSIQLSNKVKLYQDIKFQCQCSIYPNTGYIRMYYEDKQGHKNFIQNYEIIEGGFLEDSIRKPEYNLNFINIKNMNNFIKQELCLDMEKFDQDYIFQEFEKMILSIQKKHCLNRHLIESYYIMSNVYK